MTLAREVRRQARSRPGAEAVVTSRARVTYAELDRLVDGGAGALLARGVDAGDRVAAWLANRLEFVVLHLACGRIGAPFVPINPRLAAPEVGDIVEACGASLLVTEGSYDGSDRAAELQSLSERLADGAAVVDVNDGEPLAGTLGSGALAPREAAVGPDDPALIMYTSGTTGRPKGAVLTHAGLAASASAAVGAGLFNREERVLIQVPLATTAGAVIQTVPTLSSGGTLVVLERFEAERALDLIVAERVTATVAPPTILALQLRTDALAARDLGSLRHVITGAAPVPPELAARTIRELGVRLTNSYGATETGGLVTYMPAGSSEDQVLTTCGRPIPGYELRLVDEDGGDVGPDDIGEIVVRGPSVAQTYYGAPVDADKALAGGSWRSGDLGRVDAQGYLHVIGRRKDMYIRGGFNVYPAEVESVLQTLPGVVTCAVAGFADPVLGEKGRAFVVAAPGARLDADAIRQHCRSRIADFKAPDDVVFVDELPLIGPGKVDRARLATLSPAAEARR